MSFVRTLATLAAGVVAAKGVQKFRDMGGVSGVQEALKNNPQTAEMGKKAEEALARMGIGSGAGGLAGGLAGAGGGQNGMGGLAGVLGGIGASASAAVTGLIDQVTGTTAATDTVESNARLMIKAMVMAAKADGHIDDTERKAIMEHLVDSSPEERAFVEEQMAAPVDPMGLAADVTGAAKSQVYAAAVMIIRNNSAAEQQFLSTFAQALGLEAATVASIHSSLGKPAPQA